MQTTPLNSAPATGAGSAGFDETFWHGLVSEKVAAQFIGLTNRTLQKMRQRGGGPVWVRVSSRCVRYRRHDLRQWADARVRRSTSDPGSQTT